MATGSDARRPVCEPGGRPSTYAGRLCCEPRPRRRRPARRAAAGRPRRTARGRRARALARRRCSESTTAAPSAATASRKPLGAVGIELRGRLVEQQQPRSQRQRGREADALELAARELVRPPVAEVRGADVGERLRRPRPDARAAATPTFSSPNATSLRDARHHDLVLRDPGRRVATAPASCGRAARAACRDPPTSTRPAKRPPWKCGTSPASARSSVDLPGARTGRAARRVSPRSSPSETSTSAGCAPG